MSRMSFDAVAPVYDGLARLVFGHRLERAQTVWLDDADLSDVAGAEVLILGGGTGFLLDVLLRDLTRCPAKILYLEASAAMLQRAERRMRRPRRYPTSPANCVTFRLGDQTSLAPHERFDLILLPFVLDLYPGEWLQRHLIPRLLGATQPGGHWLITDFVETPTGWHRLLRWTMFRFFRLLAGIPARQLPDWPRLLADAGFVTTGQKASGPLLSLRLQRPE